MFSSWSNNYLFQMITIQIHFSTIFHLFLSIFSCLNILLVDFNTTNLHLPSSKMNGSILLLWLIVTFPFRFSSQFSCRSIASTPHRHKVQGNLWPLWLDDYKGIDNNPWLIKSNIIEDPKQLHTSVKCFYSYFIMII